MKSGFAYFGKEVSEHSFFGIQHLDRILLAQEIPRASMINFRVYNFCYSLPKTRRLNFYFTQDYKIKARNGNPILINHRGTILSLTEEGALRLTLCVISYPTSDKVGNAYIKMFNTGII